MQCEYVIERLLEADQKTDELEQRKLTAHLETCDTCQDAWRGAVALRRVKTRPVRQPPAGLFQKVMAQATDSATATAGNTKFWTGAAAGGLLVAGIVFVVLSFGMLNVQPNNVTAPAAITMALGQQQEVSIAIDAERNLTNAKISVFISGGFEFVGFGERRELSWNTDLEKGVNKLTLPLEAVEAAAGQLLVRLELDGTLREFRVDLSIKG